MVFGNEQSSDTSEDLDGIKNDISQLVKRLGSLKDKGSEALGEQLEELTSTLTQLKGKGEDKGKAMLEGFKASTQEHPVRNVLYAAGIGAALAFIVR